MAGNVTGSSGSVKKRDTSPFFSPRFSRPGASGVATTDFDFSNTYTTGTDVCRGIDFAESAVDHAFCIVAVGYSGTVSNGNRIAMAEYLPRNRIFVVSSSGGAPMMAFSPSTSGAAGGASLAAVPPTSFLLGDSDDGDLLSSA